MSLPIKDGKLDLDAVASAARRAGSIGQQLGDVASAIERAGSAAKRSR